MLPWLTYTGTKPETADTDKVNLQLTKTSSTRRASDHQGRIETN